MPDPTDQPLYEPVRQAAARAGVFASVTVTADGLHCKARGIASDAEYRVNLDPAGRSVHVGLYSPDRWLSESIEADLMNTGDHLEELVEDELIELGHAGATGDSGGASEGGSGGASGRASGGASGGPAVDHFRDDRKQYVFRSTSRLATGEGLDTPAVAARVATLLLAYEAAFRNLGKMVPPK